jgi:hypothetical protein
VHLRGEDWRDCDFKTAGRLVNPAAALRPLSAGVFAFAYASCLFRALISRCGNKIFAHGRGVKIAALPCARFGRVDPEVSRGGRSINSRRVGETSGGGGAGGEGEGGNCELKYGSVAHEFAFRESPDKADPRIFLCIMYKLAASPSNTSPQEVIRLPGAKFMSQYHF